MSLEFEASQMDTVVQTLNTKLQEWQPEIADQVRQHILEIMEMADQNALDILRSRCIEQEVQQLQQQLENPKQN